MASAWLGSPMTACQSVTGSWLAMSVRGAFGAVLDHLDEVSPLGVAQRREHPVVDREQVELGQAGEQPGVGAVAAADGQLVQQARHADVARGEAAATRAFDEGAGDEALADAARSRDDHVVALSDPRAGAEREDLLAIEPARVGEVDGLERRRVAQLGRAEAPVELALLAGPHPGASLRLAADGVSTARGGRGAVEHVVQGVR